MRFFKSGIVFWFAIAVNMTLYGNDTLIQKQIGGDEYLLKSTKVISILTESLTLDLFDDHYAVTVEYDFFNRGPKVSAQVGFPTFQYTNPTDPVPEGRELRDFKTYVDGIEVPIKVVPAKIKLDSSEEISLFRMKTIDFGENSHVRVVNSYSSGYGNEMGNVLVEYLVGSAVTWETIGQITIVTRIHSTDLFLQWLPGLSGRQQSTEAVKSFNDDPRAFVQIYNQPSLSLTTRFKALLGRTSYNWIYGLPWDYDFGRLVYPIDGFRMLTSDQLRNSRNLVYAWRGYKFKDASLAEFFHRTAWYDGRLKEVKFENEKFNEIEKRNLSLIATVEDERRMQRKP